MWRDARFRRLFRFPWRTHQETDCEIDAEVRFHLDMRTQDLVEQGVAPDEARARARREFGRVDVARRSCAEIDRMAERESRWRLASTSCDSISITPCGCSGNVRPSRPRRW